ncbi:apolipoprotein N-acyltransferase [Sphingomonas sp. GlSt437]|uniref:apolipoprotein N-acyltransferase n=1 Tax=Sphingomonas sp. GlSt437 TaxID=3389970 RepID=UPI003A89F461
MVAAAGFAPLNLWPLTLLAFASWLALVHAAPSLRAALLLGGAFGWGHLGAANLWIAQAFTYQDVMPHWLGVPAVALASLYLALYPMATAGLLWRFGRGARPDLGPDLGYALAASAAWTATEWARGTLLTGYPWPPLATIWLPLLGVAWTAKWVGTYALSGLTVATAATLIPAARGQWRAAAAAGAAIVLLALTGIGGRIEAPAAPNAPRLRIVQPDLDQEQRPRDDYPEANLRALQALGGKPGTAPRLVLWPEGALRYLVEPGAPPYYYWQADAGQIRARIAAPLGPRDIVLTGGDSIGFAADGRINRAANAIFAVDAHGRLLARYDKAHLVPFGEYLPWRPVLSLIGIERLVPGDFDYTPGPGPRTIALPGFGPVGMLVCYEVVFSGHIIDPAHRPALIFNPSNDSWFAQAGPEQHLAQARLRAIEEGIPIARATPTGVSAIIDADGRLVAKTEWNHPGAIEVPIPPAHPPTLFARAGNWLALAVTLLLAATAVAIRRRAR